MSSPVPNRRNAPRLINLLYSGVVYPLVQAANYRGVRALTRRYRKFEHLSLAENQQLQWDRLIACLQKAYDNTPFYRRRFDQAGVRPVDIQSPLDLRRLPPLTRGDLRDQLDSLCSRNYRRESLLEAATGGTTDTPVRLLRSPGTIPARTAVHLRFNAWAGLRPGDKVLYLWGARSDFAENPSWRWRLYDRYLMRRVWAPTSLLNAEILETYRQKLNQFHPRVIYGYPTPLALFCDYLASVGSSFHRPASIICTAEPLLDHQRQLIERVFGCPVFELYGSREFGMIAGECECHAGLHFNPHAAYVEFLPVEGEQVQGLHEVLVTDLLNDGMPLIRYKINDCALLSDTACLCGRGYPMVKRITGRSGDVFTMPNGDRVPGVALTNRVLQVCPGLKKLQIIQETFEDFCIRYVPGVDFCDSDLELLRRNLRKFFPDQLRWRFERVADIERERSGKTRFCISHVSQNRSLGDVHVSSVQR